MELPQGEHGPESVSSAEVESSPDFALNVYKGCVLPEDYRPIRITTWNSFAAENQDDYSPEQLELIRSRLLEGKSWVCFAARLETISAPDHYVRKEPYNNPVQPKAKLV